MKIKRILSMLLAVCMLAISVSSIFGVFAFAAADDSAEEAQKNYEIATGEAQKNNYLSVDKKIAAEMEKGYTKLLATVGQYQLYCNIYTGEVYYKDTVNGQYLTTNPYSLSSVSNTKKSQYLSQISIQYKDTTSSNAKTMDSFTDAAQRGQIAVKQIRNGIRVEYTIGRTNSNYLVPGRIREDRFATLILEPIEAYLFDIIATENGQTTEQVIEEFNAAYPNSKDASTRASDIKIFAGQKGVGSNKAFQVASFRHSQIISSYRLNECPQSPKAQQDFFIKYPYAQNAQKEDGTYYGVWVLDESKAADAKKTRLETTIKTYAANTYTFEELSYDNNRENSGYISPEAALPVFRMSLEYTIGEDGTLSVRLPANGIRYDASKFTLLSVSTLKTFGAAYVDQNDGYIFYPDGSGALIDFEYLKAQISVSASNRVYGEDFAYYNVAEKHQESIRVPVFGIVDTDTKTNTATGFVAYLTEGESLATLTAEWSSNRYAMVYPTYTPSPSDSYILDENAAEAKEWLVVSDKKFTGSFIMEAKMLSGENASWVGMANIYREKLWGDAKGLTEADVKDDLPLYIESFGSFQTTDKIFSIPVTVDKPLTTFDDVQTMYKELSEKGIKNINFKLTGFANGGMYSTYPTKIDWMASVGGVDGLNNLVDFSKSLTDGSLGIYPEFEFSYSSVQKWFDGTNLKDDAARTVDNRYANKQIYDCLYQEFTSYFEIVISPEAIARHYKTFSSAFDRYEGLTGLSAGSLGSSLNSTFYDAAPYNREDSKEIVTGVLADMKENSGSLMLSGGNAYALKYADHFLDVPLDSSQYKYNSRTVPFLGMLLHGYVNFAGSAINEAGDGNYHLLRSIENGASLYYVLSYRNTNYLKEDILLSNYYAINYEIWKDDLVKQYTKLNNAIGDLQTYVITNEEALIAERIPDLIELNRYRAQLTSLAASGVDAAIRESIELAMDDLRFEEFAAYIFSDGVQEPVKAIYEANRTACQKAFDALWVENTHKLYKDITNAVSERDRAQKIYDKSIANGETASSIAECLEKLNAAQAVVDKLETDLDAAKEAAKIALEYYDGSAVITDADFNEEAFFSSLTEYVSKEKAWGTLADSQLVILAALYENYKTVYLATGTEGIDYDSNVGIAVRVDVNRDAILDTILETVYADILASFSSLFPNKETNEMLVRDFTEALTESVDRKIAEYYAEFLIEYLNSDANVDAFGTLTTNEKAALKAMVAKFYVLRLTDDEPTGEELTGDALQAAVEAATREYLNIANNDTRELTEIQKSIIATAIAFMQDNSFVDPTNAMQKVVKLDSVDFAFENIFTGSAAKDEDYAYTDYTIDDESVVVVTYESRDGSDTVEFLLNFNVFAVKVVYNGKAYDLSAYGYERIED